MFLNIHLNCKNAVKLSFKQLKYQLKKQNLRVNLSWFLQKIDCNRF